MSADEVVDRSTAAEYAAWFKALADATRIQFVSLLARRGEPMTVGQTHPPDGDMSLAQLTDEALIPDDEETKPIPPPQLT